jgi:succinate dehydrogenase / fumarate reductase, cytochrome b subunit
MSEAVSKAAAKGRPEIRNIHVTQILGYRMPLAAIVSILHRISGALLFLALPYLLSLFEKSLLTEDTFMHFKGIVEQPLSKLVVLALVWAYLHHFIAGFRHLTQDLHIGLDKDSARKSAATVLVVSLALTGLVALKLFGVL